MSEKYTDLEVLDALSQSATTFHALMSALPEGVSTINKFLNHSTGGLEVHVCGGLARLSRAANAKLELRAFTETNPWIASFDYNGVTFFQIGKTADEAVN